MRSGEERINERHSQRGYFTNPIKLNIAELPIKEAGWSILRMEI